MEKIVDWIGYYLVVFFFVVMIISGIALWLSLLSLILIKSDILNIVAAFSVIILIISYLFLYGNLYILFNKTTNNKICDFIESTNYSRFFSIISFLFYNSLLLQIYITSYDTPLNNKVFLVFSYLPILNILVYIIIMNRYRKIKPNYSLSKFISLYIRGRLIFMFINDAKRTKH